jgi:hypothetical protein
MLMLSRLPTVRVTYARLPTRMSRGFLQAEFMINGTPLVVSCLHLDSGKRRARLRRRQLRRVFRALRSVDDAIVLGDFNMRDSENARIAPPYCDVWPMLRPDDRGFTEDTAINHMRPRASQGVCLGCRKHRPARDRSDFERTTQSVSIRSFRRDVARSAPLSRQMTGGRKMNCVSEAGPQVRLSTWLSHAYDRCQCPDLGNGRLLETWADNLETCCK